MKIRFIYFLCIAGILLGLSASALAQNAVGHAPFKISDMYLFESFNNGDELVEIKGNAAYVEKIQSLTLPCDAKCETEMLLFSAETMLVCDDMTAFTWSVQNKTDKALYIAADAFSMNYRNIPYDLFGGFNWNNYVILPGETLHARFRGWLLEQAEPGMGEFCLPIKIYSISEGMQPEFEDGSEVYYDLSKLSLTEEGALVFPAEMLKSTPCIPESLPIEAGFGNYILRITQAELSDISARFSYERIYPSEAAALADSPNGLEAYWGYTLNSDGNNYWIHAGFGSIPDAPVKTDDGSWVWQISYKVYSMYTQPEEITLMPYAYTSEHGMVSLPAESVVLQFQ